MLRLCIFRSIGHRVRRAGGHWKGQGIPDDIPYEIHSSDTAGGVYIEPFSGTKWSMARFLDNGGLCRPAFGLSEKKLLKLMEMVISEVDGKHGWSKTIEIKQ